MSYAHINGVQIYYETYGVDPPDRPPVPLLLIHGAASTGQVDWHEVAPLLARDYRVIVPDCRGHGRSTNPGRTYAFREMAEDLAELIGRLGYGRAHVIGHSNGGNAALVLLLEHSEVVQTCVLQAANAFVSPDLTASVAGWDPEWLAAERPGWVRELQTRHAPMHGRDYWRELLALMQVETLHQPNYTAADLSLAARPVLVVQGQLDRVNLPGAHGQFLAQHIPEAEAWFPEGAGHEAHRDVPWQWVQRVLDFLSRRGDDANALLDHLRRRYGAQDPDTIFEVRAQYVAFEDYVAGGHAAPIPLSPAPAQLPAHVSDVPVALAPDHTPLEIPLPGANGALDEAAPLTDAGAEEDAYSATWVVRLAGQVLLPEQRSDALAAVAALPQIAGLAVGVNVQDGISVLLEERTPWALVACPMVDVRRDADEGAGLASQALAGQPVRVLEERDGWARVQMVHDGSLGWLPGATLICFTAEEVAAHVAASTALVVAEMAQAYLKPSHRAGRAGKLPFGVSLPPLARAHHWTCLRLPDGQAWWVPDADLLPAGERPQADAAGAVQALRLFRRWIGAPYLAGGLTPYGIDGAGLAQTFLRFLGVPAPRTADRQFAAGRPVHGIPAAGDLLFFAHETADGGTRPVPRQRMSHVAISLGGYHLLQAGGGALCVNTLSIGRPRTPAARWLHNHFIGARRYINSEE